MKRAGEKGEVSGSGYPGIGLWIPSLINSNIIKKNMGRFQLEMSVTTVLRSVPGLGQESPIGARIQSRGLMSRKRWVLGKKAGEDRQDEGNLLKSKSLFSGDLILRQP